MIDKNEERKKKKNTHTHKKKKVANFWSTAKSSGYT